MGTLYRANIFSQTAVGANTSGCGSHAVFRDEQRVPVSVRYDGNVRFNWHFCLLDRSWSGNGGGTLGGDEVSF